MAATGQYDHELILTQYVERSRQIGRRCINLHGKSPDAIEVYMENGKIRIIAVEILAGRYDNDNPLCMNQNSYKNKKADYDMFDHVEIICFRKS